MNISSFCAALIWPLGHLISWLIDYKRNVMIMNMSLSWILSELVCSIKYLGIFSFWDLKKPDSSINRKEVEFIEVKPTVSNHQKFQLEPLLLVWRKGKNMRSQRQRQRGGVRDVSSALGEPAPREDPASARSCLSDFIYSSQKQQARLSNVSHQCRPTTTRHFPSAAPSDRSADSRAALERFGSSIFLQFYIYIYNLYIMYSFVLYGFKHNVPSRRGSVCVGHVAADWRRVFQSFCSFSALTGWWMKCWTLCASSWIN